MKRMIFREMACILALVCCLAAPGFSQVKGKVVAEEKSDFQKVTIFDTDNGYRWMIFDAKLDNTDAVQSEMDKANPTALTMAYSRHMLPSLALVKNPKRILVVGLGGGCLQRYLYKLMPDLIIDTAELDPVVEKMAQKYFNFTEDNRQRVTIGDGRKFIEKSNEKYDVIMLDAFSATSIPYLLSTKEFLIACKNHLADGGVLASNLWYDQKDYHDMLKTYDAVFPEWHVIRSTGSFNAILTAIPVKTDLTPENWMTAAAAFDEKYKTGLGLAGLVDHGYEVNRMASDAKVLFDKDQPKGN
ncbi:MAG TPA: fused MFS/spermidine synthase [Phycisphaerae bacterium]|jgi:spermidine synthase